MKVLAAIFAFLFVAWMILAYVIYPKEIWHYKISVTIATPEGDRTGYSIREVTRQRGIGPLPEMGSALEVIGEGVIIDLGARGQAIALLGGTVVDAAIYSFFRVLIDKPLDEAFDLPPEYHPIIIHYKNGERKWAAIKRVYRTLPRMGAKLPAVIEDNLDLAFGDGVYLKKIEVSKVSKDHPITQQIAPYLPEPVEINAEARHKRTRWRHAYKLRDFTRGMDE